MPAVRVAEKMIVLMTKTNDEEIDEALSAIARWESGFGVLWGSPKNTRDLDFYRIKARILEFIREMQTEKLWPTIELVAAKMEADGIMEGK